MTAFTQAATFFAARWAEQMVDTVTIREANTAATRGTFSELTGEYTGATPTTIYTGPAQVHPMNRQASAVALGEERANLQTFAVRIPVAETGPKVGHEITVDACPGDAALVGLVLEVAAVDLSTHATRRELVAVLKQARSL